MIRIGIHRGDRSEIRLAHETNDPLGYEVYEYIDDRGHKRSILREHRGIQVLDTLQSPIQSP